MGKILQKINEQRYSCRGWLYFRIGQYNTNYLMDRCRSNQRHQRNVSSWFTLLIPVLYVAIPLNALLALVCSFYKVKFTRYCLLLGFTGLYQADFYVAFKVKKKQTEAFWKALCWKAWNHLLCIHQLTWLNEVSLA